MELVIGIIIGAGVAVWLLSPRVRERARGACADLLDRSMRKNKNKERIVAHLKERDKTSNEDIRELLGVASRTVVNYMDELEAEGTVEQIGDTGRGTHYRLK